MFPPALTNRDTKVWRKVCKGGSLGYGNIPGRQERFHLPGNLTPVGLVPSPLRH